MSNSERYRRQPLWARGYFCAVGAVNEEMIRQYVENQSKDEKSFQIWDEEELKETCRLSGVNS